VAVEKLFDLEHHLPYLESPAAATEYAISIGKQFGTKIAKYQRRWVDPRVIGVLAVIRFLVRTKVTGLVCSSYILGLIKFAEPNMAQAVESQRLDRLIGALRATFLQG
jgi:hypothetical protein